VNNWNIEKHSLKHLLSKYNGIRTNTTVYGYGDIRPLTDFVTFDLGIHEIIQADLDKMAVVDYILDQLILPKIIAQIDLLDTKSYYKSVWSSGVSSTRKLQIWSSLTLLYFPIKIVIDVSPVWTRKSAPNLEFTHFGVHFT
jgi:hypothetical protein